MVARRSSFVLEGFFRRLVRAGLGARLLHSLLPIPTTKPVCCCAGRLVVENSTGDFINSRRVNEEIAAAIGLLAFVADRMRQAQFDHMVGQTYALTAFSLFRRG